jgi:NhaA family Na+:H+ antiporter
VAGVLLAFTVPVVRSDAAGGPDAGPGLAEHFEHRFRPISAGVAVPVFAFFAAGVLTAAAILGLAVVLPGWAAALIVAGVLLLIVLVFVLLGVGELRKGNPEPTETMSSVRRDVRVIKGTARRSAP